MEMLPENNMNDETKTVDKKAILSKAIGVILILGIILVVAIPSNNKVDETAVRENEKLSEQVKEKNNKINDLNKKIEELEKNKQEVKVAENVTVISTEMCKFIVPAKKFIVDDYMYVHSDEYTKKWDVCGVNLFWQKDVERITYTGKIEIGIDFENISYEIDQDEDQDGNPKDSGKIVIHLPEPKIQSHGIENNTFRADTVDNSFVVSSNSEEYEKFKITMMTEEENKVKANQKIWQTAKNHTESTISSFLELSSKLKDYKIEYKWDGNKYNAPNQPTVDQTNHRMTGKVQLSKTNV